ncbi:GNAT family N-acetyltransferase [Paenibacillus roseipurpureus]|uniref:GNAT family N-acetyltransferase n=1 Tax=Paenibacillus roseopurpureus TaxID=2918901 RepID=A0AA96RMK8_9BACL|nr:GNAT family N-acetyltransferase [Paenibacillus sp. MBLB1832]WNR44377.1 GNAT family N-acetyltransferase [Paenibacillus sp. MBLB1832]
MKQGIIARAGLSPSELEEVRALWEACNEHDGIEIKLNWSTLSSRPAGVTNDFVYVENNEMIGFLAIYSFLSTEVEISGMVHPKARRRGVFKQLVQAAMEECRRRGVTKLIFINERGSLSGKGFLTALGANFSFSEYVMVLDKQVTPPDAAQASLCIRKADAADTELLVRLNMSGFDMPESDTREYVKQTIDGEKERTWIAELGDNHEPIGKLGAMVEPGTSGFIYGFCVLPEFRGKGYGRQILSQTISELKQHDRAESIKLEVSVENEKALGLYESCGFAMRNAQDYYVLMLG